jgi:hypothetical protein
MTTLSARCNAPLVATCVRASFKPCPHSTSRAHIHSGNPTSGLDGTSCLLRCSSCCSEFSVVDQRDGLVQRSAAGHVLTATSNRVRLCGDKSWPSRNRVPESRQRNSRTCASRCKRTWFLRCLLQRSSRRAPPAAPHRGLGESLRQRCRTPLHNNPTPFSRDPIGERSPRNHKSCWTLHVSAPLRGLRVAAKLVVGDESMILGSHVIFGAYGFWLPNDPRGSWSEFVGAWDFVSLRSRNENHGPSLRHSVTPSLRFVTTPPFGEKPKRLWLIRHFNSTSNKLRRLVAVSLSSRARQDLPSGRVPSCRIISISLCPAFDTTWNNWSSN